MLLKEHPVYNIRRYTAYCTILAVQLFVKDSRACVFLRVNVYVFRFTIPTGI